MAMELAKYNIDIAALSETRLPGEEFLTKGLCRLYLLLEGGTCRYLQIPAASME